MSIATQTRLLSVLLLGFVGCWAAPGRAEDLGPGGLVAGSFLVRGRIIGMVPYDQHSHIDVVGGRIDSTPMVLPDLDFTYFLTDHIAVDGEAGLLRTKIEAQDTMIGRLPIGRTWAAPLVLAAQYHFDPAALINPYVGAGASTSFFFGEQAAGGYVTQFKVSPQTGLLLQAGFDYRLTDNWYANVDIRQIFYPAHTIRNGNLGGARVSLDTVIMGAGIGYRF